ncbi:long-chain fatty acid--CoA ligase [Lutibacter sp. HS1-25]|uniref:AMP-binding protein n=1 Tax=Lutibacter sp. HS1-25 TaxID=2485000 RepID=UPI0010133BCD|nr:AMP-binding protein [Lutibacter sp. HS1-25]RXP45412.1 long-chain fatty acid--CoA ligase [Lutibacter sp. HS1-25]
MVLLNNYKKFETLTYDELLKKINGAEILNKLIDEQDPITFYIQLLTNITYNVDSIIKDNDFVFDDKKDFTQKEQTNNLAIEVKKVFNSWEEFLSNFLNSNSKITIFTSGTTGKPKRVVHPVSKFIEMSRVGNKYEHNIWSFLYNPTHMAGLQVFFQALLNKNTLVYLFQCTRNEFIDACSIHGITHVSATPTFYRLLSPFNFNLEKVEKCTLGGEKSDVKLIQKMELIFPNASIHNIYASTEAGSLFISKGDTFRIIDKLKDKIKFQDNEIVIHKSLLGNFDTDEWFRTGDLVEFIDETKKEFRIVSRKSDTVNVGGNRVNLLEIENEIHQMNGIVNAVVYAIDNSVLGKIIVCEVVSTATYTPKEFKEVLKQRLQLYKIPTKVKFVQELQTTRTGKLKRS